MRTLFAVRNTTGEDWPAFAMARLGTVILRDGFSEDIPLYNLVKPDGAEGIYVVNRGGVLLDEKQGTGTYYQDARYVLVGEDDEFEVGDLIGAVADKWEAGAGANFQALDEKNEDNIIPVVPLPGSGPYWAVNIGSLAAPALSVSDGVVSGKTTGVAALFTRQPDGKLKVSDGRQSFERYADGDVIGDGTLIQLDNVSGKITIVFANCAPTTGLTGLDPTP